MNNTCYPFDLCYSKCRFSTGLVFNVYYLCKIGVNIIEIFNKLKIFEYHRIQNYSKNGDLRKTGLFKSEKRRLTELIQSKLYYSMILIRCYYLVSLYQLKLYISNCLNSHFKLSLVRKTNSGRASLISSDYYQPRPKPPRNGLEEYYLGPEGYYLVVLFRAPSRFGLGLVEITTD